MKVMHVGSEFFPLIKTGGLADVIGSLPLAQRQTGLDVRLLLPGFPSLTENLTNLTTIAECHSFAGDIRIQLGYYQDLPVYLIDAPDLYQRPGNPYHDYNRVDYADNYLRFALLGWVSCELAKGLDPRWRPEIVQAHDWHSGLCGAYLALNDYPARSVFTIHNLAYQGLFSFDCLAKIDLPASLFQPQGLEFHGQISYLKAGLFYADHITTVSPTYAKEICQSQFGHGLDGLLQERQLQGRLMGILNGIDESVWDPANDQYISLPFHAKNLANKKRNKAQIQAECQLEINEKALLFVTVSRLTSQKGLDLLLTVLPDLLAQNAQFILLGSGEEYLEEQFYTLSAHYPQQSKVLLGYDEALSHRIIAGADVIVIPSRFEPCGLTQLYGLKYGVLPLVRATGGLADTVTDCSLENIADDSASGFVFQQANSDELYHAVRRAFALWQQPRNWQKIQRRNMQQSRSWYKAALAYSALYQHILDNNR